MNDAERVREIASELGNDPIYWPILVKAQVDLRALADRIEWKWVKDNPPTNEHELLLFKYEYPGTMAKSGYKVASFDVVKDENPKWWKPLE